jgi:hypothetical protein
LCWWNVMRHMATCLRNTMNKCYERNCQKNKMIRLSYTQYPYRSVGDHHTVSCLKEKNSNFLSSDMMMNECTWRKKRQQTKYKDIHTFPLNEWLIDFLSSFLSYCVLLPQSRCTCGSNKIKTKEVASLTSNIFGQQSLIKTKKKEINRESAHTTPRKNNIRLIYTKCKFFDTKKEKKCTHTHER